MFRQGKSTISALLHSEQPGSQNRYQTVAYVSIMSIKNCRHKLWAALGACPSAYRTHMVQSRSDCNAVNGEPTDMSVGIDL